MEDPRDRYMDFQDYVDWRSTRRSRSHIRSFLNSRFRTSLMTAPYVMFNHNDNSSEEEHEGDMEGQAEGQNNANIQGAASGTEAMQNVSQSTSIPASILDESVLVLGFPLPPELQPGKPENKNKMPFHIDIKSRTMQNDNFIKIYDAASVRQECIFHENELHECIHHFLHRTCSDACLATIVFNGHGGPRGLTVRSGHIVLDDLIKRTKETFESTQLFPFQLDIVFGQCYSHLHSWTSDDRLRVISFTSPGPPKLKELSVNIVTPVKDNDKNIIDVSNSRNMTLETYALERQKSKKEGHGLFSPNSINVMQNLVNEGIIDRIQFPWIDEEPQSSENQSVGPDTEMTATGGTPTSPDEPRNRADADRISPRGEFQIEPFEALSLGEDEPSTSSSEGTRPTRTNKKKAKLTQLDLTNTHQTQSSLQEVSSHLNEENIPSPASHANGECDSFSTYALSSSDCVLSGLKSPCSPVTGVPYRFLPSGLPSDSPFHPCGPDFFMSQLFQQQWEQLDPDLTSDSPNIENIGSIETANSE